MFEEPSLVRRIAIGKLVGFFVGLAGFFMLPLLWPESGELLRWGILLWYATLGAIIGVFGVFTYHPVLQIPMPWWFRAPLIGAWMNFVLVFFTFDAMRVIMVAVFGNNGVLESPFWFVAEGAIVGFIIGYLATRFGGEGRATVGR